MTNYQVIEDRGCGISYLYRDNLYLSEANKIASEMNHRVKYDETLRNGNGDPYEYIVFEG